MTCGFGVRFAILADGRAGEQAFDGRKPVHGD
jgi:hypothetical protein